MRWVQKFPGVKRFVWSKVDWNWGRLCRSDLYFENDIKKDNKMCAAFMGLEKI